MKNLFFLAALFSTLLITGCTSTSEKKVENIKSSESKTIIYGVKDTTLRDYPLSLRENKVLSQKYTLDMKFNKETIDVSIINMSKDVLFVNWTDAKYIGFDGKEQRLFNMNEKDKGFYVKPINAGIRPGEVTVVKLVPINNLKAIFGSSTTSQEIFIDAHLFSNEDMIKEFGAVIIPISLDSKKGPIVNNTIYFGKKEVSKEVETILNSKPTKAVVQPKTNNSSELKTITTENSRLNNEINNKDEIIKGLKEKARLKAELQKKELEIQELMKKLNEN
ncbi:hypothetical protein [Cetobacterium sp.]|uniref:hypothetical protein n=1 Tax=Cetobacterium sp. TaxID=2071632 RepID=UPI003F2D1603